MNAVLDEGLLHWENYHIGSRIDNAFDRSSGVIARKRADADY